MITRCECEHLDPSNSTLDQTAGSHSLAAAGQRGRWAASLAERKHATRDSRAAPSKRARRGRP
jgi:hypothetical protein